MAQSWPSWALGPRWVPLQKENLPCFVWVKPREAAWDGATLVYVAICGGFEGILWSVLGRSGEEPKDLFSKRFQHHHRIQAGPLVTAMSCSYLYAPC